MLVRTTGGGRTRKYVDSRRDRDTLRNSHVRACLILLQWHTAYTFSRILTILTDALTALCFFRLYHDFFPFDNEYLVVSRPLLHLQSTSDSQSLRCHIHIQMVTPALVTSTILRKTVTHGPDRGNIGTSIGLSVTTASQRSMLRRGGSQSGIYIDQFGHHGDMFYSIPFFLGFSPNVLCHIPFFAPMVRWVF